MMKRRNPAGIELVQLVPILCLAFPFIVAGKVELGRAGAGFLLGAALTLPVTVFVVWRGFVLNPILIGAGLWLWGGAVAFNLPVESLAAWLRETQAFGLFVAALGVGVVTTFASPHGFVGCRSEDSRWLRAASLGLLGLTLALVGWVWVFRHNIRLGGGLPFIVLNLSRRVLCLRAPGASHTPS